MDREIRRLTALMAGNYQVWRDLYAPTLRIREEDAPSAGANEERTATARADFCRPLL
jgi:hypothetical protein